MEPTLQTRYRASMLLAAAGDAIGYYGGTREFNYSGADIHAQLDRMGGSSAINVAHAPGHNNWIVSDDTVLNLATAEALIEEPRATTLDELMVRTARHYVKGAEDMSNRAPGRTTLLCLTQVRRTGNWHANPFNHYGMGCGAAMRAMCIGLRYPRVDQEKELIEVAVESSRITHHHPTAYLGSVACALFTAYALQGRPVESWGRAMLDAIPRVQAFVAQAGRDVEKNTGQFHIFEDTFRKGLEARNILDGIGPVRFPESYGVQERDDYYNSVKHGSGMAGACGDDAALIAYDALLGAGKSWNELLLRGILHGGDNDSTGTMAGAWFGALYGFESVPDSHYKGIEYFDRLESAADALLGLSQTNNAY